jgi:hypothetical protein
VAGTLGRAGVGLDIAGCTTTTGREGGRCWRDRGGRRWWVGRGGCVDLKGTILDLSNLFLAL